MRPETETVRFWTAPGAIWDAGALSVTEEVLPPTTTIRVSAVAAPIAGSNGTARTRRVHVPTRRSENVQGVRARAEMSSSRPWPSSSTV
ncbi:MAG: hypothetical protein EAS51_08655 [Microbacteriaceae bacterium]|nr:MAG: hypothetical protein EAS51_08655 [Microbacteriaceae bacterium]